MSKASALVVDAGVGCVDLDGPRVISSQMGFTHFYVDRKMPGSVEKVGVAPDPKRVGPASWNLEHG